MATAISYKDHLGGEFLSLYPKRASFEIIKNTELEKFGDDLKDMVIVNVESTQHDSRILRMELVHFLNTGN